MGEVYRTELANAYDKKAAAQTNTSLVAAVTGKKIKVAAVYVSAAAANTFAFLSGASGTEKFNVQVAAGLHPPAFVAPPGEFLFETAAGAALVYTSSTTAISAVTVLYQIGD